MKQRVISVDIFRGLTIALMILVNTPGTWSAVYGPSPTVYRKISIRTVKLIGLGLFLGAFTLTFPFIEPFGEIRFPGVLQRIGVVFFAAAILFLNTNWKTLMGIAIIILLGYWVWLGFIPLNGEAPTFERAPNNWANYIDLQVFGTHMYMEDYDPEGLLSTFPSIVTSLLGIFTSCWFLSRGKRSARWS